MLTRSIWKTAMIVAGMILAVLTIPAHAESPAEERWMAARKDSAPDPLGGLWGGDSGPLGGRAGREGGANAGRRGVKSPGLSDLVKTGSGFRSLESMLRVIRQHSPGLEGVYRRHSRFVAELQGRVTLKMVIASNGAVLAASPVATTTGVPAFDNEIAAKTKTWRFEPVKGQSADTLLAPFTFTK